MDTGNNETENKLLADAGDYLWDGSGEPDPEIQKLELSLGKFRHDRPAPVFPEMPPEVCREIVRDRRWRFVQWRVRLFPVLATTAVVAIAVAIFLIYGRKPIPAVVAGWDVSRVAGSPRIGPLTLDGN